MSKSPKRKFYLIKENSFELVCPSVIKRNDIFLVTEEDGSPVDNRFKMAFADSYKDENVTAWIVPSNDVDKFGNPIKDSSI